MEKYRQQPDRKHNVPEGGLGSHGFQNRQPELVPHGGGSKIPESQSLSGAWKLLEHRIKVYTPDPNRDVIERIRQKEAVNRWMAGLKRKGTDHDKLIIDLYSSITIQPGASARVERELTQEEFQQFRSKVEPLSNDEIAEELRKSEDEKRRKIAESLNTNRPLTLAQPQPIWEPPHPATGTFS